MSTVRPVVSKLRVLGTSHKRWASTHVATEVAFYPSLKGKLVAITGAGGGMGLKTARRLALSGAKLSLSDAKEKGLYEVAEEIEKAGGSVIAQKIDVANEESVNDWIETTVKKFGKLDGAVNLAGILPSNMNDPEASTIFRVDTAVWQKTLAINLTGLMFCVRAQVNNMNNNGSIVNAGSVAGLRGYPGNLAYGASKFGVIGITKNAAIDVGAKTGIRINAVAPGTIKTPMIQDYGISTGPEGSPPVMQQALQRDGYPEEVAGLCCWLLSDEAAYVTGSVYQIEGGHIL